MKVLSREELLKKYDDIGPFREGLAWARKGGKCFHIHPNGTPVYKERYDNVGSFQKGLALVRKGSSGFYIRPDGTRA